VNITWTNISRGTNLTDVNLQSETQNPETKHVDPRLATSFGGTVEKNIPEDVVWIDDTFYIKKTRFGLYTSILKHPLGQHFLTGLVEENVIKVTRWHLKCLQDDTLKDYTRVVNSGVVGGKL
tara:strand:- start:886 stop:1251 length:366 start_codon:yes stop_codon:yes gene_type:complete